VPDATVDSKPPTQVPEAASPEKPPNRAPAFIAFGVGAAALTVGTVSGIIAFGKKSDVKQACEDGAPRCDSELESGNRAADIATGAFIAAGAAIGVGAALWFAASGSKTKSGKAATLLEVRPMLTHSSIGLGGRF
jgi:methyl coenzyme M reductase beta subunit